MPQAGSAGGMISLMRLPGLSHLILRGITRIPALRQRPEAAGVPGIMMDCNEQSRPFRVSPDQPAVRSAMSLHALMGCGDGHALPAGLPAMARQVRQQGGAGSVHGNTRRCAPAPQACCGRDDMGAALERQAALHEQQLAGQGAAGQARAAVSSRSTTAPSAAKAPASIISHPAKRPAGSCGSLRRQGKISGVRALSGSGQPAGPDSRTQFRHLTAEFMADTVRAGRLLHGADSGTPRHRAGLPGHMAYGAEHGSGAGRALIIRTGRRQAAGRSMACIRPQNFRRRSTLQGVKCRPRR